MATIIDALMVTLGLDASGYKVGTEEVAKQQNKLEKVLKKDGKERAEIDKKASIGQKKRADAFEKQGKRAAETFGKIREHALGLIAVLAGGVGLAEFGKDVIGSAASLDRLSHNLGISMKTLQAFGYAQKAVGGKPSDMMSTMEAVTDSVQLQKNGGITTPQMLKMNKYGIGVKRDAVAQIMAASKYLSALYKINPSEAWSHANEMGLNSIFNLIKHYRKMQTLLASGRKIAALNPKLGAESEAMQLWWANFSTKIYNLSVSIFTTFLPALNALQSRMSDWANWAMAHKSQIVGLVTAFVAAIQKTAAAIYFLFLPIFQKMLAQFQTWASWAMSHQSQIVGWLHKFVDAIIKLGTEINAVVQSLGGWKVVLLSLLALKVISMVSPLLMLAGAIAKVGASLLTVSAAGGAVGTLAEIAVVGGAAIAALAYSQKTDVGEKKATTSAERREQIMSGLKAKGFMSNKDAAAFAGNLKVESDFNPEAVGDNGRAYGIAQWHAPRQAAYKKLFGISMQKDPDKLAHQIEFMRFELKHNYETTLSQMKSNPSVYWKSAIVTKYYERPANLQAQTVLRAKYAQEYAHDPIVTMRTPPAKASAPVPQKPTLLSQITNHIGAKASAPVRSVSAVHNTSNAEAHVGQVIINTNSQNPAQHGRLAAEAIHRYLHTDALNSGVL